MKIYYGKWLILTGNYNSAEKLLGEVIEELNSQSIYNNIPSHNTMVAKLELVYAFYKNAKYEMALELANSMLLDAVTAYPDKNNPTFAKIYYYIGCIHLKQNNINPANTSFKIAFDIQEKIFKGLNHPDVAETLREMARIEIQNGNYHIAEMNLKKSLDIQFSAYGKSPHPEISETYSILAELAFRQRHFSLAIRYQNNALLFAQAPYMDINITSKFPQYKKFEKKSTIIKEVYHQKAGILFFFHNSRAKQNHKVEKILSFSLTASQADSKLKRSNLQ